MKDLRSPAASPYRSRHTNAICCALGARRPEQDLDKTDLAIQAGHCLDATEWLPAGGIEYCQMPHLTGVVPRTPMLWT